MSAESTCAFVHCQAGGVIMAAPLVSELRIIDLRTLAVEGVDEYHPGCWAAELRRGVGRE